VSRIRGLSIDIHFGDVNGPNPVQVEDGGSTLELHGPAAEVVPFGEKVETQD